MRKGTSAPADAVLQACQLLHTELEAVAAVATCETGCCACICAAQRLLLCGAGRMVYVGPREELVPFFSWIGLRCPERKNVADFVQEICSEKDQEVRC